MDDKDYISKIKNNGILVINQQQLEYTKIISIRENIFDYLKKNTNVMEIGTGSGDFAQLMWDRLSPNTMVIIDPFYGYYDDRGRHALEQQKEFVYNRFNNLNVSIFDSRSEEVLGQIAENGIKYGFAYIDSSHDFLDTYQDLNTLKDMMDDNGVIGIDDYCFTPPNAKRKDSYKVQEAVTQFLAENREWKVKYFSFNGDGMQNLFLSKSW